MSVIPPEASEALLLARRLRGWTQELCAWILYASPNTLSKWERGLLRPSPKHLRHIALSLQISPALFFWEPTSRHDYPGLTSNPQETISNLRQEIAENDAIKEEIAALKRKVQK